MSSQVAPATVAVQNPPFHRSIGAAIALILTAPLVAEYLLGDLPLKMLVALVVMAPMYGGGALLIREVVRRTGRGWPSILLLGAAYTVIEEAFTTQSLFNPDYLHLHVHFLTHAWIPFLHIGAWWTLFMFNLHTFWSISVSIALVEALFPNRAEQPWLGRLGDSIVALLFLAGCAASTAVTMKGDRFVATPTQFAGAGIAAIAFIVAAFLLPRRQPHTASGPTPPPSLTGAVALILGLAILFTPPTLNWGAVVVILAIDVAFLLFVRLFSRRATWTPLHTFSLAAGGALAYGLHAFAAHPLFGTVLAARISNAIFLAAAIEVILIGARRTKRSLAATAPQPIPQ
jgi:hypothetical protein